MKHAAILSARRFTVIIVFASLGSIDGSAFAASPTAAENAIQQYVNDYVSDAFDAIAEEVAFEPYPGLQRGAEGTALSASGNSIDQAMLLARVLEGKVSAWRLANGRLDEASISHLLRESGSSYSAPQDLSSTHLELYDPINDKPMRRIVRNHFWLEIQEETDDEWLALDPAFPGATVGRSFAKASRYFDAVPENQKQHLSITFMQQTASGRSRRLGNVAGSVAELSQFPIALVVRGIPQYEGVKGGAATEQDSGMVGSNAGGLLGGGGGSLFGGGTRKAHQQEVASHEEVASNETERAIVGIEYRRELTYGGKEPEALTATMVSANDGDSNIAREWIEFRLRIPGQGNRTFNRDLFVASEGDEQPAAIRRYSIAVVAGEMTRAAFDDNRGALDPNQVNTVNAALAKLRQQPASNEVAYELMQLESNSALAPFLINLAFAYESDALSVRLAAGAGVRIIRDIPRVLITSIETGITDAGDVRTATTLDLRLDEVHAQPMGGWPVGAAELFQRARGMQESALEGRVLARFVEESDAVVTTEHVMREAQQQGHLLVAITSGNRAAFDELENLPLSVATRIGDTLDNGHQVIVPTAAATINGRRHWGWWDVDPASGAFVGVMQSGQHQAMTQYTVTLEEIGVNDAMGYVIGAMVGSTATLTLYSAKMIEYGAVTAQLIQEVAAGIEQLTCVTCPGFKVSVSALSGSAGFSSQCFDSVGAEIDASIGVSGGIDFCENYKRGISCAASLMLGTFEVEENVSISGPSATLDLGPLSCE